MYRPPPSYRVPDQEYESILVYGTGDLPMSMLAIGLARNAHAQFTWADCGDPRTPERDLIRDLMRKYASGRSPESVDATDLESSRLHVEAFNALITSTNYREFLLELLRLPPLFQEMVPFPPREGDGHSFILTRVDALPERLVRDTLQNRHLHQTLHRSRLTLVATFRGDPSEALQRAFYRVFGVEDTMGPEWTDAMVWAERGTAELDLLHSQSMKEAWTRIGLDRSLLTTD